MINQIPFTDIKKIFWRTHSNTIWTPAKKISKLIEESWTDTQKKAQASNSFVFNGPLVRCKYMSLDQGILTIDTELTDYKHHVATRTNPELENRANPLYISSVIYTTDNKLIFGRTSNSEQRYIGLLNIPAGNICPKDDLTDSFSSKTLLKSIFREFSEEIIPTKISDNLLKLKPSFVAIEEQMQHPSIIYEGTINLHSNELRLLFEERIYQINKEHKKPELNEIQFIDNNPAVLFREIKHNRSSYHNRVGIILDYLSKR